MKREMMMRELEKKMKLVYLISIVSLLILGVEVIIEYVGKKR